MQLQRGNRACKHQPDTGTQKEVQVLSQQSGEARTQQEGGGGKPC